LKVKPLANHPYPVGEGSFAARRGKDITGIVHFGNGLLELVDKSWSESQNSGEIAHGFPSAIELTRIHPLFDAAKQFVGEGH
jgi:hypothetical protein